MSRAEVYTTNIHPKTNECDFRTPPYLFHFLNLRYGIDYDAACEDGVNNLAPALRLEDVWPEGSTVYSNPPYDKESILKWFTKGKWHAAHGGVHIMCLPNKICQTFFTELIDDFSEVIMLGGRVDFSGPHSVKGGASRQGTMITVQCWDSIEYPTEVLGVRLSDLKKKYKEDSK